MAQPSDDLKCQFDRVRLERRRLADALDASGIALHRVLHSDLARRRAPSRFLAWVILLVSAVVLSVVLTGRNLPVQTRPSAAPSARAERAIVQTVSNQPAPARDPVGTTGPFSVHVRATRPSRVRVVVDGAALDWRSLQEGDELVARPRREMVLEGTDGGALATAIDGKSVALGGDGQEVALRITPDGLFPYNRR